MTAGQCVHHHPGHGGGSRLQSHHRPETEAAAAHIPRAAQQQTQVRDRRAGRDVSRHLLPRRLLMPSSYVVYLQYVTVILPHRW